MYLNVYILSISMHKHGITSYYIIQEKMLWKKKKKKSLNFVP